MIIETAAKARCIRGRIGGVTVNGRGEVKGLCWNRGKKWGIMGDVGGVGCGYDYNTLYTYVKFSENK